MTPNKAMLIGISGSIGTGKSTVTSYLKAKGYPVIDLDLLAREAVDVGTVGLEQVILHFGKGFLQPDGSLNRKALGTLVFSDATKRSLLNSILHPLIHERMYGFIDAYSKAASVVFVDAPLLFENQMMGIFHETWLVYAPECLMLRRICLRDGLTESEGLLRISAQMPIEEKRLLATRVIENSHTLQALYEQVDALLFEKHLTRVEYL